MIIRQDKTYETNSSFPDSDWYNEGNYIIDETIEEGKELAKKIKSNYPYYDLVIENNKVIDITLLEKPEVPYEPTENEVLWQTITQLEVDLMLTNQELTDAEIQIEALEEGVN